jgi:hypothetical protein
MKTVIWQIDLVKCLCILFRKFGMAMPVSRGFKDQSHHIGISIDSICKQRREEKALAVQLGTMQKADAAANRAKGFKDSAD